MIPDAEWPLYYLTRYTKVTTGSIIDPDFNKVCVTLELPWNDNKQNTSCIPEGTYKCVSYYGKHYQNVWEVLDVPGRENIFIRSGEYATNTKGCILVGNKNVEYNGMPLINDSVNTLNKLRATLPKKFLLKIAYKEDFCMATNLTECENVLKEKNLQCA